MNIENDYNKINTPEELLDFMKNNIKYGFSDENGKVYGEWDSNSSSDFQTNFSSKYRLLSPSNLIKNKYGVCWDQVELERDWFKRHNYECKTFFIWFYFKEKNNYITHTYLVYRDKISNKYCYFENSDFKNMGIHEFDSYKDAIEYQRLKHISFNKECGNIINDEILSHLEIYDFDAPKYGCSVDEYFSHILNSKIIYENNKYDMEIY